MKTLQDYLRRNPDHALEVVVEVNADGNSWYTASVMDEKADTVYAAQERTITWALRSLETKVAAAAVPFNGAAS